MPQHLELNETQLIDTYRQRILYFALRRLRDRAMAEDVAQETLLAVIQALREQRLREEASVPGYVFAVAKNLVFKAMREQPHQPAQQSNPAPLQPQAWLGDPEAELLLEEQRQGVLRALTQLSSGDQDILRRSFNLAQSLEQIARDLGIPYVAARKRKSRALERLRKIFLDRSQNR